MGDLIRPTRAQGQGAGLFSLTGMMADVLVHLLAGMGMLVFQPR